MFRLNIISTLRSVFAPLNHTHDDKVDKVNGKGLSTNDYTTDEKNKLEGIAAGANKITVDSALSSSSTNPVQNKVINTPLGNKVDTVSGKGLSTNDYTTTEKNKLAGITESADAVSYSQTSDSSVSGAYEIGKITINGTATTIYGKDTNNTYTAEATATNIKMNGTQSAGSLSTYARGDHVHPSDTSKENTNNKVTSITNTSTNTQYPSAKAVYELDTGIKYNFHQVDNNTSTSYYCKFFRVEYSAAYSDTPINFTIYNRSQPNTNISFYATWDSTNNVYKIGNLYYDGYPREVYVHHVAQNTFDFYLLAGTWGNFVFSPITTHKTRVGNVITVTKTADMVNAVPTSTDANPVKQAIINPYYKDTTYSNATTSANGLMSSTDKSKLDGIAAGANKITVDSALSSSSTNPVQNKVINTALGNKVDTVSGKGLSTNDYTTTEKNKLAAITESADAVSYSQTVASSTSGAYEVGKITINGTATTIYGKDTNNTYSAVGTSGDPGLMTAADKVKLNNVATGATKTSFSYTNGVLTINNE
ncbi:hypothetical protein [Methanobrevibacter sp.]|uniref:hypothetical protein n=1 Tax=Methanobrevibacter sp. TaxID=66852 RepID=UPI003865EBAE